MSKVASDPNAKLLMLVEQLERRTRQLERSKNLVFRGTRTDDPDGNGTQIGDRCIVGQFGSLFGIRVWDAAGTLTYDHTS